MAKIMLTELMSLGDTTQYKLHLATASEGTHPLDVYVRDVKDWHNWSAYRGNRNQWNRRFIFSLIQFRPITDAWLFGGAFRVRADLGNRYDIEPLPDYEKYEGRVVCGFHRQQGMMGRAFKLENFIAQFEIIEVLREKYNGERFCGYDRINHSFVELRAIIRREKSDWKAALSHVKGVYLITDKTNGKTYVGSAYGTTGLWTRLCSYVNSGHGGNDALISAVKEKGLETCLLDFHFALLEVINFNTPDDVIIAREAHWKHVMHSRAFGYNRN